MEVPATTAAIVTYTQIILSHREMVPVTIPSPKLRLLFFLVRLENACYVCKFDQLMMIHGYGMMMPRMRTWESRTGGWERERFWS